ncbi:hypothetical protein Golob_011854 [Gossypium lobatum]|uniref:Uncharacterized protein n=1 Tax=Gossypium lobatum TaxID=34289 RepID=A0A7J8MQU4_9ROSI|nr:hypothetical protein [Gossypium lobatum]
MRKQLFMANSLRAEINFHPGKLIIGNNSFGGKVHKIFGRFTQLKSLTLHENSYTDGILSSGIHKLTNMSQHDLSYNNFSGELPVEISLLLGLKFLILGYNQFTSDIPSRLLTIDYSPFGFVYNILTKKTCRTIRIGLLKGYDFFQICGRGSPVREYVVSDFSSNEFNGKLPAEMGKLPLIVLNISRNEFSGQILTEIGNIRCLKNLDLLVIIFQAFFSWSWPPPPPLQSQDKSEFWKTLLTGYGCGMVLGVAILYSIFQKGEPHWFATVVDGIHEWRAKRLLKRKLGGKSEL